MVNVLGVNDKIIITVLMVYYCEMKAATSPRIQLMEVLEPALVDTKTSLANPRKPQIDKLEFWEPNPVFNRRRAAPTTVTTQATKPRFRNDAEMAKYTKGFYADIRHSAPKHILRHGDPHLEILQKSSDRHQNTDTDHTSDTDESGDKTYNSNKNKNQNKEKDMKHYVDRDNKDKYNMDKKRIIAKNHMDQNRNINKNQNTDKNYNTVNKYTMDKHPNIGINQNVNTNQDTDETDDSDNNNKPNKFPIKDKKYIRDKDQSNRIPKLNLEAVRGHIMESQWPAHEHPSKLRTHKAHKPDEDIYIRSTRMTPMYLMQQPSEEETKPVVNKDSPLNAPLAISPYSITQQMKDILAEFSEANATVENIGRTVEYNDIVLIKITQKKSDEGKYFRAADTKYIDEVPEKKILFIVHGLSVMGMSKLATLNNAGHMKILLSYYLKHLDKFDIFLMPMANPDGYSAAHTISLWNKNMSPQDACPGVALDRNFDVAWNVTRQISSCSQLYPGPAPFSETETKAVRDVFHYHGHKILGYIHVHAGTYSDSIFKGDAILYPRGYSESQSDDDKYIDLKGEIDEAMKNASFQVMSVTVDTLHNWYGKVSGSSVDYASSVYGIPYALEFVMQLYADGGGGGSHETYEYYALTEIWSRLIDTTFSNMWKSLHVTNEVRKK